MVDPTAAAVELRQLVDRYGLYVDRRDYDRVAGLFAEGGTLSTTVSSAVSGKKEIVRTVRDALVWFADSYGFSLDGLESQHFVGNHVCDIHGQRASGTTYCLARLGVPKATEPTIILNVLRYEDEYEITPEGWRFSSRNIVRLWTEQPAVATLRNRQGE